MIKEKGQIVPKRFVRAVEKKSQHLVKFGCKVSIEGNKITALEGGTIIYGEYRKYVNTRRNKKTVKGFVVDSSLRLIGAGFLNSAFGN